MVVPEIMPGEILWGHFERFLAFNGFDCSSAVKALRQGIEPSNGKYRWPTLVELLAGKLGMSTQQICQHFTTLPFDHAVTDNYQGIRHGDPAMASVLRYKVKTYAKLGGVICPDCVVEDEGYWGFGYFRREHQLPGINHCSKHQTHLLWQTRSEEIFFPDANNRALKPKVENKTHADGGSDKSLFMENYLGIIDHWLMQTSPIPVRVFKNVINERKPHLDQEVHCALDAQFFRLTNRAEYVPGHHAAALLAAMFESAEDALNAIQEHRIKADSSGGALPPERFPKSLITT